MHIILEMFNLKLILIPVVFILISTAIIVTFTGKESTTDPFIYSIETQ